MNLADVNRRVETSDNDSISLLQHNEIVENENSNETNFEARNFNDTNNNEIQNSESESTASYEMEQSVQSNDSNGTPQNHNNAIDYRNYCNRIIQGIMYQQAYHLYSPDIINDADDKNYFEKFSELLKKNGLYNLESEPHGNTSEGEGNDKKNNSKSSMIEYVMDIMDCNKVINYENKTQNNFHRKSDLLSIGKKYQKLFQKKAKPTIPLTIIKGNDDKYKYSFFFDASRGRYFENMLYNRLSPKWTEGLLNISIFKDDEFKIKAVPCVIEMEWCFDFRPTNLIFEKLELNVLQNSYYNDVFSVGNFSCVDTINWYIHFGLTDNIINNNHTLKINRNVKNRTFLKQYHYDKTNFYGIPIVDYNENKNNSFLWQYLPINEKYEYNRNPDRKYNNHNKRNGVTT